MLKYEVVKRKSVLEERIVLTEEANMPKACKQAQMCLKCIYKLLN